MSEMKLSAQDPEENRCSLITTYFPFLLSILKATPAFLALLSS